MNGDTAGEPGTGGRAIVVFGDVVGSRLAPVAASTWLRRLCADLEALYDGQRIAPFAFTQGDELQALLPAAADPVRAVLLASLHAEARPMRWAIVFGGVESGEGPATERAGDAYLRARRLIEV